MVRQVDHQVQCALMADAWGNEQFARPEPFAPLRDAAAWHDEGWRRWEDAPHVDGDGRPVDFPDLDRAVHVALYREGIGYALDRSEPAALLVSMHGQGLYERRLGLDGPPVPRSERRPEVRAFLEEQSALQRRLGTEAEQDWCWAAYRLLQAWDLLSLYLVWRALPNGRSGRLPRVPRRAGDETGVDLLLTPSGPASCACEPYPFNRDPLELPVTARVVEDRAFADDDDLRAALAAAERVTLRCVVHRSRPVRPPR